MKSVTKKSKVLLNGILLSIFIICCINSVQAQSDFTRNDNYDFRGLHHLTAGGYNPDDFNIFIESNSDFRIFKLHIKRSRLALGASWNAFKYRIDMNNDGVWEQNWTTASELTITHNYPNPPNGISSIHTIRVDIIFSDGLGQSVQRTKFKEINIFSTPRVYFDSENNSFVQLRNQDASNKIPVLMVEGFDPLNDKFPDTYYNLTWELINTDLYPNNFEVFILNFNDGGRDLRLNAEVVTKAIRKIREVCPNYKIVIAGLSMGGPIVRYALSKMESQDRFHHVGLFLSYDSPQWWAHISPDLQDWIKIQNPNDGAIGKLQETLQSVAAKQMLYYNTYDPNNTYRLSFYNELNNMNENGYPHKSYNVAVSNGNFKATWGYGQVGRHLMTLKINNLLIKDVPAVQLDCGAGSMFSNLTTKRYGDILHNPFIHVWYELEILFNPSYIPTYSALDLVNPHPDPLTGDITSFERSKFDSYVVPEIPLQHHELSEITRDSIMTWLNKNSNILVNYSLQEGGALSADIYPVKILNPIQITVTPKPIIINNKSFTYHFVKWEDGNTENPRTFYTSHNVSYNAIMKGSKLSNDNAAFKNNSQRKVARTNDGVLHVIYSSMGKIWYEKSSDNGANWLTPTLIAENDHESEDAYCRNPAIAAYGNRVGIVYQKDGTDPYDFVPTKLCTREIVDGVLNQEEIIGSYHYSANIYPVTSYSSNNFVIVWKPLHSSGLYIKMKNIDLDETWSDIMSIPNTNYNSSNPSLYYNEHYSGGTVFDTHVLAWQQYFGESANGPDIRIRAYDNIYGVGAPSYSIVLNGYSANLSTGSGFATNQNPSVTVSGSYPMVSWTGMNQSQIMEKNDGTESITTKKVVVRGKTSSGWSSTFFTAGDNVEYSNIMGRDNPSISDAIVSWSENNGQQAKYIKRSNGNFQCASALSSNGIETQLSPASTFSAMKAYVFNNNGNPPYAIVRANNDFNTDVACKRELRKTGNEDDDFEISFGRSGIIVKNDLQFVFNIGDILLNDEPVLFIERNDTLPVNNIEELNSILKTEPFYLDGNSSLIFSNYFYVLNKEYADSLLGDDDIVSFRSELVKVSTGQVAGTFNTVNYSKTNLVANGHRNYEINCSGIDGGMYYFRLASQTEGEVLYFVANVQSDASVLAKRHYANINYDGNTPPEEYALLQNYPNPFNPATIINYQIPADGFVTLKVYDILGKEVATLVNEQQTMGRYSINFNASKLASGVYIYELRSGEFIQSKKMMLLR